MRIIDWSSDVCSSDLSSPVEAVGESSPATLAATSSAAAAARTMTREILTFLLTAFLPGGFGQRGAEARSPGRRTVAGAAVRAAETGRASGWERGWQDGETVVGAGT